MDEVKTLPFRANGHQARVADGTLVDVYYGRGGELLVPAVEAAACRTCDARLDLEIADGAVLTRNACPYPDGITHVVALDVPSGKMIISDSLRPVYDWDGTGLASYNTALGQAQAAEAMADAGCAFGFAGNTSPGLYSTGTDTYIIASPGEKDGDVPLREADRRASIWTDLWAYSAADFEDWKSRGGDPAGPDRMHGIVDVTPGTYQFTHHSGEHGFRLHAPGTLVIAHVERVTRPARPKRTPVIRPAAPRRSR